MTCKHEWRIKVELFLDIPTRLERHLNKKTMREREVEIEGANWPKSYVYCRRCGTRSVRLGR
jgi:hypothetical protein